MTMHARILESLIFMDVCACLLVYVYVLPLQDSTLKKRAAQLVLDLPTAEFANLLEHFPRVQLPWTVVVAVSDDAANTGQAGTA